MNSRSIRQTHTHSILMLILDYDSQCVVGTFSRPTMVFFGQLLLNWVFCFSCGFGKKASSTPLMDHVFVCFMGVGPDLRYPWEGKVTLRHPPPILFLFKTYQQVCWVFSRVSGFWRSIAIYLEQIPNIKQLIYLVFSDSLHMSDFNQSLLGVSSCGHIMEKCEVFWHRI